MKAAKPCVESVRKIWQEITTPTTSGTRVRLPNARRAGQKLLCRQKLSHSLLKKEHCLPSPASLCLKKIRLCQPNGKKKEETKKKRNLLACPLTALPSDAKTLRAMKDVGRQDWQKVNPRPDSGEFGCCAVGVAQGCAQ